MKINDCYLTFLHICIDDVTHKFGNGKRFVRRSIVLVLESEYKAYFIAPCVNDDRLCLRCCENVNKYTVKI